MNETKKMCNKCGAECENKNDRMCRKCRAEYRKNWAAKNKEKIAANTARYQKDNAEFLREYKKNWRLKNPDKAKESIRQWKLRNPDKVLADGRKQDAKRLKKQERKDYMKDRRLKEQFSLSLDAYRALVVAQNGLCAICGKAENHLDRAGKIRELCVDHCHKGGHVRQLLCNRCNTILGRALDNADVLEKCAQYLRKHSK